MTEATAINGQHAKVRLSGERSKIRYRELSYVGLNVSDAQRSRAFYEETVGLQYTETGADGDVFLRCSRNHHNVILRKSGVPGLRQIGWELEDEDVLEAAFAELSGRGVDVRWLNGEEAATLHLDRAFCGLDPTTGVRFDFFSSIGSFATEPYRPTVANILRIGHVVLKTASYEASIEFATTALNFRVSDTARGKVTFMRAFPLPYHHGVGLISGSEPRLHHVNFMVETIDDVGRALARLQDRAVPIVYGPGRHPPSDSIFLYFLDPDGLTLEYSFGMELFPEVGARKPRTFEPIAALDYWSSRQDPRFGAVGAIDVLGISPR